MQSAYAMSPAVAKAGLLADAGANDVISKKAKAVAQITTITIAVVDNNFTYYAVINGVQCSYVSDGTATEAEINAGLIAAINDSAFNGDGEGQAFDVTAAQGATTETIVVTGDATDVPFSCTVVATNLTVALTTAPGGDVPFGLGVAQATADADCRLPSAAGDVMLGISVFSQAEPQLDDGTHEYADGSAVGVLRKGRIWAVAEEAVVVGDNVFARHTASANGSQRGALRTDADGATAVQITQAEWVTSASAGELAIVAINKPV